MVPKSSNCIVIHGCPSNIEKAMNPETRTYDKHWIPWLKRTLIVAGVATETPLMPEPWAPNYATFKQEFEKYPVSESTILVGHSCGCAFLVRWLGETKKKVHKLILVAPWKTPKEGDTARGTFYSYIVDRTIRDRVREVAIFTSDDEEHDGKVSAKLFHDALGGKVFNLAEHGHYTMDDMGSNEFPELLDVILR